MNRQRVIILGAGPAGLGAAFQLARGGLAGVTVLEQSGRVGGNAGSFDLEGQRVDYGSHRLHPACNAEVLQDIRALLGDDLLDRPRHGRILLRGRWIHFPLKPIDLFLRLSPGFAVGVAGDLAGKMFRQTPRSNEKETFATVLQAGLGKTICRDFYFPYARKIWGMPPEELSPTQAYRRVSAGSLSRMARRILSSVPGFKPPGSGRFFYPRYGYGQISEAYSQAAQKAGAEIHLNARVHSVETTGNAVTAVQYETDGRIVSVDADHVWSTIPISVLVQLLRPGAPAEIIEASKSIQSRGMILIYLVLEQKQFSEYDAHYFPELRIQISRLTEPKNYSNGQGSPDLTVLCAELPCERGDEQWNKSDAELGELVRGSMETAGIPLKVPIRKVVTRRLGEAYPIYQRGYETYFNSMDQWIGKVKGLLTFGRQGLFAHDNTHHALYMAYAAAKCLTETSFDLAKWHEFRTIFETHVVED